MKISLCITCCHKDINLLDNLLQIFRQQTSSPFEIIIYSSGILNISLPSKIVVANTEVPLFSINSTKLTMQSIARNVCSSVASGDILMFFDVDDFPHCQKIEITKHVFQKHNCDFFVHSYSNKIPLDLNKKINIDSIVLKNNLTIAANNINIECENFDLHHAHISVKKKVFDNVRFNENILAYRMEDSLFCKNLLESKYNGLYTPEKLVQYNR